MSKVVWRSKANPRLAAKNIRLFRRRYIGDWAVEYSYKMGDLLFLATVTNLSHHTASIWFDLLFSEHDLSEAGEEAAAQLIADYAGRSPKHRRVVDGTEGLMHWGNSIFLHCFKRDREELIEQMLLLAAEPANLEAK